MRKWIQRWLGIAEILQRQQALEESVSPKRVTVVCPICDRSYPDLVLMGRRSSVACHCGNHLEVMESGQVRLR